MEEPGLTHGIGGFRNRRDLVGREEETASAAGQAATRQCKAWPTGAATVATVHLDPLQPWPRLCCSGQTM